MSTQAKYLLGSLDVKKAAATRVADRQADRRTSPLKAPYVRYLKFVERLSYCSHYKGYRLTAHATPGHGELYAADVVIQPAGGSARHFRALDYFYTVAEALVYATRWGRIWVDYQLSKIAERPMRPAERQP
jgi:hypothetical protein